MSFLKRSRKKLTRTTKKKTKNRLKGFWTYMTQDPVTAAPKKQGGFYQTPTTFRKPPKPTWKTDSVTGKKVLGPIYTETGYGYYDTEGKQVAFRKFSKKGIGSVKRSPFTTTVSEFHRDPPKRSEKSSAAKKATQSGGKCGKKTAAGKRCQFPSKTNCPHHKDKIM